MLIRFRPLRQLRSENWRTHLQIRLGVWPGVALSPVNTHSQHTFSSEALAHKVAAIVLWSGGDTGDSCHPLGYLIVTIAANSYSPSSRYGIWPRPPPTLNNIGRLVCANYK